MIDNPTPPSTAKSSATDCSRVRVLYQWCVNLVSERAFDLSEFLAWHLVGCKAVQAYRHAVKTGRDIPYAVELMESASERIANKDSIGFGHSLRCLSPTQADAHSVARK